MLKKYTLLCRIEHYLLAFKSHLWCQISVVDGKMSQGAILNCRPMKEPFHTPALFQHSFSAQVVLVVQWNSVIGKYDILVWSISSGGIKQALIAFPCSVYSKAVSRGDSLHHWLLRSPGASREIVSLFILLIFAPLPLNYPRAIQTGYFRGKSVGLALVSVLDYLRFNIEDKIRLKLI